MNKNNLKNYVNVWYEASFSYGRLSQEFTTKEEALEAIKNSNNYEAECGYTLTNYYIMYCVSTRVYDSNNQLISDTLIKTRV